jgi:ComEC/Rec2-related protein
MKTSIHLNQYLPVWCLTGYLVGILLYRFIPNQFILLLLLIGILFAVYSRNRYFQFFLGGLIVAYVRLSVEAHFKNHIKRQITFGPVKVIGQLKYGDRKNLLTVTRMDDAVGHRHSGLKVIVIGDEVPDQGDLVWCEGDLIPLSDSYIPQSTDSRFDLFFKNIIGFLKIKAYHGLKLERTNPLQKCIYKRIEAQFPPKIQGLLFAILLGDPSKIDQEVYQKMLLLGISHLMVVSAMHFALFGSLYYLIFRYIIGLLFPSYIPIQLGAKFAALLGSCLYFLLVQHNWSVIRSFISIIISIVITLFKKHLTAFQITCLTLFIMLLIYPYAVFELGFQLSFISVFTLILFKTNLITSTLYVTLTTAPFILYEHGYFNLQPFLASIICIPWFSFVLMPLTVLGVHCYFPTWITQLLSSASQLFFSSIEQLSTMLVVPVCYYITSIGLLFVIMSFLLWVLTRSQILTCTFLILSGLTATKKRYPSILIDRNLKDIFLYRNGIVYSVNLESWKNIGVKKFFNSRDALQIPDNFKTRNGYFWDIFEIITDKNAKFTELRAHNLVIVRKWDLINRRSSALVILKRNKITIKFNDDTIQLV